jgi:hypothetical protein
MRRLILIDFDGTLFDTKRFKKELAVFGERKYGISEEEWRKTYKKAKNFNGAYNYFKHIKGFTSKTVSVLQTEFDEYFKGKSFIYSDVLSFLTKYNKERIVIFTLGIDNFQLMKIRSNNLVASLETIITDKDKTHYWTDKLIYLSEDSLKFNGMKETFKELWYIDNRSTYFTKKPPNNVRQIRIKRKGDLYSASPTPNYAEEVESLGAI